MGGGIGMRGGAVVGIAHHPLAVQPLLAAETAGEKDLTLDTLLARADEAMYLSKKAGRNHVTAWEKN